jgi:hypothetical protein
VTILGSAFYILALCTGIFQVVQISKKRTDNKLIKDDKKTLAQKLARIIEGCILFSGLILMMVDGNKGIRIAGMIMWVGSIILYFLSGIIIENITKTPLEFGYGGWRTKRFKTKRRQ